jgi:hypothetical protein
VFGRGAPAVLSWGSSPLWLSLAYCVVYFHVVFVGVAGFYVLSGMSSCLCRVCCGPDRRLGRIHFALVCGYLAARVLLLVVFLKNYLLCCLGFLVAHIILSLHCCIIILDLVLFSC